MVGNYELTNNDKELVKNLQERQEKRATTEELASALNWTIKKVQGVGSKKALFENKILVYHTKTSKEQAFIELLENGVSLELK